MSSNIRNNDWRIWLRRKIGWLLAFKLAALMVLWMLFFSPAHRISVDDDAMIERFTPSATEQSSLRPSRPTKDTRNHV